MLKCKDQNKTEEGKKPKDGKSKTEFEETDTVNE